MGSCYSCRSNGGPPTYTTVAMATTIPESLPHRGGGGGGNGGGSSLRGVGGGGGSFGFRKRTPVLVKSQFKERTGELVHLEQQKKQTTTTTAVTVVDDVRNGNLVNSNDSNYSNNKLPCMVKTQLSGLPRPQLPVLLDKKLVTTTSESMRVSPNEEEEMMMLEADSGLGNSLSERKNNEGDTETLAEVDQIEGDNISIRSKRESPSKTTMTDEENNKLLHVVVVDNNNQVKVPKASGIARFKYSNPVKNSNVSQLQATKVNLGGGGGIVEKKVPEKTKEAQVVHNQAKIPRKIPLAVQLSNRTGPGAIPAPVTGLLASKAGPKKSTEGITKRGLYYSSPSKVGGGLMKKDELRQKENITPEVVEVVPINLNLAGSKVSESGLKVIGSSYKSPRIESVLPSSIISEPTVIGGGGSFSGVRTGGGSGRWSSQAKDTPDSSLHDSGPYSPPSEKDFFLIDDEIADQPALINCQQLNGKDLRSYSRSRLSSVHVLTDMNEEGGVPAMAHLQSCLGRSPLTRRRLSHSIDTLSPCSSLASDDLMMDFDRLDETLQSRPLSEVFGDGFQLVPGESKSAEHFLLSKLNSGMGKMPGDADHVTRRSVSSQKTSWILGGGGGSGSGSPSPANVPGRSVGSLGAPPVGARRASEEIEASVDLNTYRLLTQDITNVKTLLLRLKRLLQEADHEPHPLAPPKNGLIVHSNAVDESKASTALEQENADLRRQVVFLQQQLEEKERSIRLLQQQHARNNVSEAECREAVSVCNAACQTERQRSTLNSFLTSSANNDDSLFGSTVSFSRSASSSIAARVLDKA